MSAAPDLQAAWQAPAHDDAPSLPTVKSLKPTGVELDREGHPEKVQSGYGRLWDVMGPWRPACSDRRGGCSEVSGRPVRNIGRSGGNSAGTSSKGDRERLGPTSTIRRYASMLVAGLLLVALVPSPAEALSEDRLYSGPLGALLAASGLQHESGLFVTQLNVSDVDFRGEKLHATAYRIATDDAAAPFIGMVIDDPFSSSTALFIGPSTGESAQGWLYDEIAGVIVDSESYSFDLQASSTQCELATTLATAAAAYKVPVCGTSVWGALGCAFITFVTVGVVCDPTDQPIGPQCTSPRVQWYPRPEDPTGCAKGFQEVGPGGSLFMVSDVVLKPTLCFNATATNCQYMSAGGAWKNSAVYFRVRTQWPTGTDYVRNYTITRNQEMYLAVETRSASVPPGNYKLIITAEENGQINDLLSSGWQKSEIFTQYTKF